VARADDHEFWSFGQFRVCPKDRWVERSGVRLAIGGRALDLLIALLERAGEVVSKRQLLECAWPGSMVDEVSLRVQIAAIRRILGDGKDGNRFIANVAGTGYTFTAVVSKSTTSRTRKAESDRSSGTRVPILPSRMIGRENELSKITRQLLEHRFVTVVGPGGIGKTTLAVSAANALASRFGGNVRFIGLSALSDPELVAGTIASSFGVRASSDDPARNVVRLLRAKRMLLLLDCCEHLIDTTAIFASRLIAEAPDAFVLVTSREPLRADGEHVLRLFPLDTPPAEATVSAAKALSFPVVQLFVERASAVSDRFELTDAIAPTVVDICRRLDGIPLAIELAAARIGVFGVMDIPKRLKDVLTLLSEGRRSALPRHQTLRATLDWSYRLLSPCEQSAMRRLSVFRGHFTLDSAIGLVALEGMTESDARHAVGSLVSKSLLSADHGREPMLYRFLDTTRAYAAEQLAASGELARMRRRYSNYCARFFEDAESDWEAEPGEKWVLKYSVMLDDVRAVQDWAFAGDGDPLIGIKVTADSAPLMFALLLMEEYADRAEHALKFVDRLGLEGSESEMKLRLALGVAVFNSRGTAPTMASAPTRALAIAEQIGATSFQLRALWQLARERSLHADYRHALEFCEQFDAVAKVAADSRMLVVRDRMMALGLFFVGRLNEARGFAERAVSHPGAFVRTLHMSFNEYDHRVASRSHLARILWPLGLTRRATVVAEEGVQEALKLGYAPAICYILSYAAVPIAFWSRDLVSARSYIGLLKEHSADLPHGYWHLWSEIFERVADRENEPESWPPSRHVDAIMARVRDPLFADILATLRADFVGEIVSHRLAAGDSGWSTPEALRGFGRLAMRRGDREEARALFQQSMATARNQGALSWELRAGISLAELCLEEGRDDEVFRVLAKLRARLEEDGSGDVHKAKQLLASLDEKVENLQLRFAPRSFVGEPRPTSTIVLLTKPSKS
jgi:predicted ATPase/DNA-binding winged helix-turn-helix (wHTH) protein